MIPTFVFSVSEIPDGMPSIAFADDSVHSKIKGIPLSIKDRDYDHDYYKYFCITT